MSKKDNNIIEDNGEWLVVDISTKTHANACMEIDRVDYDLLKSMGMGRCYAWRGRGDTVYARARSDSGKVVRIHRVIRPKWCIVDHIDGCGTNNRGNNLRSCTQQQNAFNSKTPKSNTSGAKGVHQLPSGSWEARIRKNYKVEIIGYYDSMAEAIDARKNRELELFGEYSAIHRNGEKK